MANNRTVKKILHISKCYYPFFGGIEATARDCVLSLKDGFEQKVIAFNDGKSDAVDIVDGIEVYRCGCFTKIRSQPLSLSYKKTLKRLLDGFKPDLIVFHYPNPFAAACLLNEIKKRKCKLVIYWHADIVRQKILGSLFAGQNEKLLKLATKVISTSPNYINGSKWLKTVKNKCVVIPSCIEDNRVLITPNVKKTAEEIKESNIGKTICVTVGRHTQYKGTKYLIDASKLLDDEFVFYIVGSGELTDELKKLAHGDNKVIFTGKLKDDDLKAYLLACDIFCFPSIARNEAFGLALAEAMYFSRPSVTFTIPGSGVNWVSLDGKTGIEVENKNIIEYANALKRLSNDAKLRQQMGKEAKKRAEALFTYANYKKNISSFIKGLFDDGGIIESD